MHQKIEQTHQKDMSCVESSSSNGSGHGIQQQPYITKYIPSKNYHMEQQQYNLPKQPPSFGNALEIEQESYAQKPTNIMVSPKFLSDQIIEPKNVNRKVINLTTVKLEELSIPAFSSFFSSHLKSKTETTHANEGKKQTCADFFNNLCCCCKQKTVTNNRN